MKQLVAGCCGLLFGLGLILSEMVNPARVQGFLDWFGQWDPTLAFVMAGALSVTIPLFLLIQRRGSPILADVFAWPTRRDIDASLIVGAVLFGAGWGLAGFCPGPAVTAIASLRTEVVIFVAAMLTGMWLHRWWQS